MNKLLIFIFIAILGTSCVSSKKYNELTGNYQDCQKNVQSLKEQNQTLKVQNAELKSKIEKQLKELGDLSTKLETASRDLVIS